MGSGNGYYPKNHGRLIKVSRWSLSVYRLAVSAIFEHYTSRRPSADPTTTLLVLEARIGEIKAWAMSICVALL